MFIDVQSCMSIVTNTVVGVAGVPSKIQVSTFWLLETDGWDYKPVACVLKTEVAALVKYLLYTNAWECCRDCVLVAVIVR